MMLLLLWAILPALLLGTGLAYGFASLVLILQAGRRTLLVAGLGHGRAVPVLVSLCAGGRTLLVAGRGHRRVGLVLLLIPAILWALFLLVLCLLLIPLLLVSLCLLLLLVVPFVVFLHVLVDHGGAGARH